MNTRKPLQPTQLSKQPSKTLKPQKSNNNLDFYHPQSIGPWKLCKTIGKGSSACRVKLACHEKTNQMAAIKIVAKSSLAPKQNSTHEDPWRALRAVEREIAVMKMIDHPNIISLYDVWETSDYIYMIMEYASGGELFSHLVERAKKNASKAKPGYPPPSRALPADEALRLFQQLMYAVSHVHNLALCHRDLKPENVLLASDGSTIKLADFGMATLAGEDIQLSKRKTKKGRRMLKTSCGSPHYASPEVVQGKPYIGHTADIWSCGVILFALLTGRLPFHDENLHVLLSKVKVGKFEMPHELDGSRHAHARNLLTRMLESDPNQRITMPEILRHPYFTRLSPPTPMATDSIPFGITSSPSSLKSRFSITSNDQVSEFNENNARFSEEINEINDEIFSSIRVLCQGESEETLRLRLSSKGYNIEKRLYVLIERFKDRRALEELAQMEAGASDEARAWERSERTQKALSTTTSLSFKGNGGLSEVTNVKNSPTTPNKSVKRFKSTNDEDASATKTKLLQSTNQMPLKKAGDENEVNIREDSLPINEGTALVRTATKRQPLESSTESLENKHSKKPYVEDHYLNQQQQPLQQQQNQQLLNMPMETPSSSFAASIAASIGHVEFGGPSLLIPLVNEEFKPPSIMSGDDRMMNSGGNYKSRFSNTSSISNRPRSNSQYSKDDIPINDGHSKISNIPIGNRTLRKKPAPLKVDVCEYHKPFQVVLDDESGDENNSPTSSVNTPPPRPISKSYSSSYNNNTNGSDNYMKPPPLPPKSAMEFNTPNKGKPNENSRASKILRAVKSFDQSVKQQPQPNRKGSLFGLRLGGSNQSKGISNEDYSDQNNFNNSANGQFKLNIFSPNLFTKHSNSSKEGISPSTQIQFEPKSAPPDNQNMNQNIPPTPIENDENLTELRRDTLPFANSDNQPKRKSSLSNIFKLTRTRSSSINQPLTPNDTLQSPKVSVSNDYDGNVSYLSQNNNNSKRWFGGLFQPKTASPLKSTFVQETNKKQSQEPSLPQKQPQNDVNKLDLEPPVNPFKKTVRRTRSVISQLTVHN